MGIYVPDARELNGTDLLKNTPFLVRNGVVSHKFTCKRDSVI